MSILAFQMPEKVAMEKADDFHGLFTFKPLEKGYGVTIGNALRRILLSSLEGYAITGIKVPGVLHEFSTIEGVVEDVAEIILNLKMVRFRKVADNFDSKITVSIKKQKQFKAGDIAKFTSAFEIRPTIAIVVDVTFGKGTGATDHTAFPLGKGATLGIGASMHPFLHKRLKEVAERVEIPVVSEAMPAYSSTDADAIQLTAEGIPTMVIGIPLRYMHTPVEVIAVKDVQRVGRLLAEFISSLEEDFFEKIIWE